MNISLRLVILGSIIIAIYSFLLVGFFSPSGVWKLVTGPSEQELGIKTYPIASDYQKYEKRIKVLVPDNMDSRRRYPVLYILPVNVGIWDKFWINGIREAALNGIHNKHQIICVYPMYDRMPWFGDHPADPFIRQESHLLKAVIPYVEQNFPVIREPSARLLVGFSKSGWAAYSLLLRHPHLFGKAASWDAPLMFDDIYQWGTGLLEVFATQENFRQYFLPDLLEERKALFQQNPPRFVLMGYAFIQDHTEHMHGYLAERDIPHIYDITPRSRHTWESGWLPEAVDLLLR